MEEELNKIYSELKQLKYLIATLVNFFIKEASESEGEESEGKLTLENPNTLELPNDNPKNDLFKLNDFRNYIN